MTSYVDLCSHVCEHSHLPLHVYMHMYQVCRVTKNVWTLAGDDHSPLQTHRVPGQAQATELVLADFVAQSGFY